MNPLPEPNQADPSEPAAPPRVPSSLNVVTVALTAMFTIVATILLIMWVWPPLIGG